IGQYRLSYILLDTPGGLRLVDQHVAHERVLYDRYLARITDAAPVTELVLADVDAFLRKLIDASIEERGSHVTAVREKVCASLSCQAAIKVHRPLSGEEMARLVAELLESSNPYACP